VARILINSSFAPSLVVFRQALIAEIVRRGHEVHVSAPNMEEQVANAMRSIGAVPHSLELRSTGLNPFGDLAYARALYALIRRVNADLVVGYTIKPNIWGAVAARLAGVRSVSLVTGLGYSFIKRAGLLHAALQAVIRRLYRFATNSNSVVIFQNGDDLHDFVVAGCLADRSKARLVSGSGIDTCAFAPVPLPADPVFLMISRYLWTKGLGEYCEAATIARQIIPAGRWLVVGYPGTGPDAVSADRIAAWKASGIEFLGEMGDVRPALAEASIYVLPSYREGTPRSVLEAMAMGRPVITTDAPGCRETVSEGINGLLVPVRDSASLAEAMIRLAVDPEMRARFGAESRKLAESCFEISKVNEVYLAHLDL
jgi:glycosyltransferase involved in cell wall biosynthesis